MTKKIKIIIAIIIIVLAGTAVFLYKTKPDSLRFLLTDKKAPIVGCYAVNLLNDEYVLDIKFQDGENFVGGLSFKNYQYDSSSGTFTGTYKNGILLGNYQFTSEGADHNLQLIFKKFGDHFVRGSGETNASGDALVDLNKIEYDPKSPLTVFKAGTCYYNGDTLSEDTVDPLIKVPAKSKK